jgi:hypothetical protein
MCEFIFEYLDYFTIEEYFNMKGSICFLTKVVEQIKPIKVFNNFKDKRLQLIKSQKDKTGVYCLVNLVNGNIYIGSSVNLAVRMKNYLNTTFFKQKKIIICLL